MIGLGNYYEKDWHLVLITTCQTEKVLPVSVVNFLENHSLAQVEKEKPDY